MSLLVDLHTHAWPTPDAERLVFHSFHQKESGLAQYALPFSAGLHPWFLEPAHMEPQWAWLDVALSLPNLRMVGEIGLDRLRGPALDIQVACLEKVLLKAEALGKPALFHCVRAYEELNRLVSHPPRRIPLILHGFTGGLNKLKGLLPYPYYFSFGAAILRDGHPVLEAFQAVPIGRLFLETDDSGRDIADLYDRAAQLRRLSLSELEIQIWENSIKIGIA
ncbi:MAG: TatD family hydrolase [Saprospiraceae bacterium]|jgi:TatD DNase family protein